jgi:hypothetical protein
MAAQKQTQQNAGKRIPVLRRKTAFMFEGKEAFPHSDNLQHRYPLWDFYPGIYDRSRQFEICLRNSVKRIQRKQIHCERSR